MHTYSTLCDTEIRMKVMQLNGWQRQNVESGHGSAPRGCKLSLGNLDRVKDCRSGHPRPHLASVLEDWWDVTHKRPGWQKKNFVELKMCETIIAVVSASFMRLRIC